MVVEKNLRETEHFFDNRDKTEVCMARAKTTKKTVSRISKKVEDRTLHDGAIWT